MWQVYALRSQKVPRIYVGMTSDLSRRLNEHNKGKVFSTKVYRPWKVIYTEDCADRLSARQKEKYWKSGYGKELLKKL